MRGQRDVERRNGNLLLGVTTKPITLKRDITYNLFISVDPREIDAIHRASVTLPVPAKKTMFKPPRLP